MFSLTAETSKDIQTQFCGESIIEDDASVINSEETDVTSAENDGTVIARKIVEL